jgi:hypothetical protein
LNRLADFGLPGIPGWLGLPYVAVMIDHNPIRERFTALSQHLDERSRRVFAAAEAKAAGYGGIAAVWRATGIAPSTINRGLKELAEELDPALRQVRRPGGGRKSLVECDEQRASVFISTGTDPGVITDRFAPFHATAALHAIGDFERADVPF